MALEGITCSMIFVKRCIANRGAGPRSSDFCMFVGSTVNQQTYSLDDGAAQVTTGMKTVKF